MGDKSDDSILLELLARVATVRILWSCTMLVLLDEGFLSEHHVLRMRDHCIDAAAVIKGKGTAMQVEVARRCTAEVDAVLRLLRIRSGDGDLRSHTGRGETGDV